MPDTECKEKVWMGSTPKCDLCQKEDLTHFVDGKTQYGPWAMMCLTCHKRRGLGLGTGQGQLYEHRGENKYVKIKG